MSNYGSNFFDFLNLSTNFMNDRLSYGTNVSPQILIFPAMCHYPSDSIRSLEGRSLHGLACCSAAGDGNIPPMCRSRKF